MYTRLDMLRHKWTKEHKGKRVFGKPTPWKHCCKVLLKRRYKNYKWALQHCYLHGINPIDLVKLMDSGVGWVNIVSISGDLASLYFNDNHYRKLRGVVL